MTNVTDSAPRHIRTRSISRPARGHVVRDEKASGIGPFGLAAPAALRVWADLDEVRHANKLWPLCFRAISNGKSCGGTDFSTPDDLHRSAAARPARWGIERATSIGADRFRWSGLTGVHEQFLERRGLRRVRDARLWSTRYSRCVWHASYMPGTRVRVVREGACSLLAQHRRRLGGAKEVAVSRFTETMYTNAQCSPRGMTTGEPDAPVRHTWGEVHERARRIAGGLATSGVGHGDAVAVLAGAPVEIAPTAQAIWMRGATLTMLHQPTPRTDLQRWAEETTAVIKVIDAKAVVVSDPFMPAAPLLSELGMQVLTIEQLLDGRPIEPVDTADDDLALLQLTSGSTGSPKAVQLTHSNFVCNAEAMFVGARVHVETDVIVSGLPLFHDMGMTGFLTVPMYFGAELVKITPMDFLRDTLLWARLIDKYKGTMTAD